MRFVTTRELEGPFEDACTRVVDGFKEKGFGVLTTVDVQEVLRQRLGKEVPPYRIYGICNPKLADQALDVTPEVGVMLPCSVVVRWDGSRSHIHVLSPSVVEALSPVEALSAVMAEAERLVAAVVETLTAKP